MTEAAAEDGDVDEPTREEKEEKEGGRCLRVSDAEKRRTGRKIRGNINHYDGVTSKHHYSTGNNREKYPRVAVWLTRGRAGCTIQTTN
jgi:hypothetical protein